MVGQGFWSDSALTAEEKEAIAWEKRTNERSEATLLKLAVNWQIDFSNLARRF